MVDTSGTPGPSRRKFLAGAGASAAVIGVAGAGTSLASGGSASTLHQSVVITTVDATKGVFNVLVGEREVQVTDRAFAAKIADAIR